MDPCTLETCYPCIGRVFLQVSANHKDELHTLVPRRCRATSICIRVLLGKAINVILREVKLWLIRHGNARVKERPFLRGGWIR